MTLYNVRVPVVDLVHADTPEAAISQVAKRLTQAGFEPHYDEPEFGGPHAFESEVEWWCIDESHEHACPQPCEACDDECPGEYVREADIPEGWR